MLAAADAAEPDLKWLVIDRLPITRVDATGLYAVREILQEREARGGVIALATRQTEWNQWMTRHDLENQERKARFSPTLRQAVRAFDQEHGNRPKPSSSSG